MQLEKLKMEKFEYCNRNATAAAAVVVADNWCSILYHRRHPTIENELIAYIGIVHTTIIAQTLLNSFF